MSFRYLKGDTPCLNEMVALPLLMKAWHSLSKCKGGTPSPKARVALLLLMKWRHSLSQSKDDSTSLMDIPFIYLLYTFYIPSTYLPYTFYILSMCLLIPSIYILYILYILCILSIDLKSDTPSLNEMVALRLLMKEWHSFS